MKTRPIMMKYSSEVRVKLYEGKSIPVFAESSYRYTTSAGGKSGTRIIIPDSTGEITFSNERFILQKKMYRGSLKVHKKGENMLYVNHLPIEEYLVSVVGHEMSPSWPEEALKAQAVVARTYVLKKMGNNTSEYDIGNDTTAQVYGGMLSTEGNVRQAVYKTISEKITYRGNLASVFFHSCCGGETASASEVWRQDFPYLVRKTCDFKDSPQYNWEVHYPLDEVQKKLGYPKIINITVGETTASKRVKSLQVKTSAGTQTISASLLRQAIGPERMKSTLFKLQVRGNLIDVQGHGYGHGVGLCQWCAKIMVEKKSMKYRNIIQYFFPGTSIQRG